MEVRRQTAEAIYEHRPLPSNAYLSSKSYFLKVVKNCQNCVVFAHTLTDCLEDFEACRYPYRRCDQWFSDTSTCCIWHTSMTEGKEAWGGHETFKMCVMSFINDPLNHVHLWKQRQEWHFKLEDKLRIRAEEV